MHHLHRNAEDDLGDEVSEEMDIPADPKVKSDIDLKALKEANVNKVTEYIIRLNNRFTLTPGAGTCK